MSARQPAGKLIGARTKFESTVKRLYCTECSSMQDARKIGRAREYALACGHTRALMSSEQEVEPCHE